MQGMSRPAAVAGRARFLSAVRPARAAWRQTIGELQFANDFLRLRLVERQVVHDPFRQRVLSLAPVLILSTFPVAQNQTKGTLTSTRWRLTAHRSRQACRQHRQGCLRGGDIRDTVARNAMANGGFATD